MKKKKNKHVNMTVSKEDYVQMRTTRDATLDVPKLLYVSVQVNINAGKPLLDDNGVWYVKYPVTFVEPKN